MPEDPFQDFLRSAGRDFNRSKPVPPPLTEGEWRKVRDDFRREFPSPSRPGFLARLRQRFGRRPWVPLLVPVAAFALVLVMFLQGTPGDLEFRYPRSTAQARDLDPAAESPTLRPLIDADLALNLDLVRGQVRLTLAEGTVLEGRTDPSAARPDALRIVTLSNITLAGQSRNGDRLAGTLEVTLRLTEDAPTNASRLGPAHFRWSKMVLDLTAPDRGTNHVGTTRQVVP